MRIHIPTTFEVRDNQIWAIRKGRPPLLVATEIKPLHIYTDNRGTSFALGLEARPADRPAFTFRIEAGELFDKAPIRLAQSMAWHGIFCEAATHLGIFLRENLPVTDPVLVSDIRYRDDDEPAQRGFKRAWDVARKRAAEEE